nr:hypothetical protein Iba_chr10bCG7500 [Ipomoea batatas]
MKVAVPGALPTADRCLDQRPSATSSRFFLRFHRTPPPPRRHPSRLTNHHQSGSHLPSSSTLWRPPRTPAFTPPTTDRAITSIGLFLFLKNGGTGVEVAELVWQYVRLVSWKLENGLSLPFSFSKMGLSHVINAAGHGEQCRDGLSSTPQIKTWHEKEMQKEAILHYHFAIIAATSSPETSGRHRCSSCCRQRNCRRPKLLLHHATIGFP